MRALIVTWLTLVALAVPAHAGEDIGVVVIGDPGIQAKLANHLERWLEQHGHAPVEDPLPADAINSVTNCFILGDDTCASRVIDAQAKVHVVVFARVVTAGENITFETHWFVKGHAPVGERRVCEHCTTDAWHEIADQMMTTLSHGGARVVRIVVHGGHSRVGPILLLSAGLATAGAGIGFLYYGSLGGSSQKYIYPDSTPFGIGLTTLGIGGVIVGSILLVQAGHDAAPVVAIGPRGGYLGWATRF